MITCPTCKNKEYEGTLYCSECGSQLWTLMDDNETAALNRDSQILLEQSAPLIASAGIPPDSRPAAPDADEIIVRIDGQGVQLPLTGKAQYSLGRGDPAHQVIPDVDFGPFGGQHLGVSRRHATLQRGATGVTLTDLASANGTMLNGRALEANETVRLKNGDEISLGRLLFKVYFVNG